MKILFITDSLQIGGVLSYISGLSKYLKLLNDETFVFGGVLLESDTSYKDYFKYTKVHSYTINSSSKLILQLNILINTFLHSKKVVRTINPNIIHLNLTISSLGFLLTSESKKFTKIFHFHGAWDLETRSLAKYFSSNSYFDSLKNYIRWRIQKYCLNRVEKILVLSEYSKNILINHFYIDSNKIVISKGGVDNEIYYEPKNKSISKRKMGLDSKCVLILALSRMEPRKGIHLLINSIRHIANQIGNFKIIIATSDLESLYFREIPNMIYNSGYPERITIQPIKTIQDNTRLYQAADIFITPSIDLETFGLTTIEALSCGDLVIGTKCGATPEILAKIKSFNFTSSNYTEQSLAKKIIEVANLNKKKKRLIKAEITMKIKNYYWQSVSKEIRNIYLNTLQENISD